MQFFPSSNGLNATNENNGWPIVGRIAPIPIQCQSTLIIECQQQHNFQSIHNNFGTTVGIHL
jgi:hypothetical protein